MHTSFRYFCSTAACLVGWMLSGAALFFSPPLVAQENKLDALWSAPEIEQRIAAGIGANRMGKASLRFVDRKGKPVRNVQVWAELTRHAFLFGSNVFMLNGFDTEAKNRRYEEVFASLFNYASAPFYWKDLEPRPGALRFAANSPAIYRRPAPDAVLPFCQQHRITVKGHTLVWDHPRHSVPEWLPADTARIAALLSDRIAQIAARYGSQIPVWDVVNEVLERKAEVPMPADFAFTAFRQAERAFPASAQLLINETTGVWTRGFAGEYSPYYLLIQNLLLRGARVDGIGMQFHFFSEELHRNVVAGEAMQPAHLFRVLDQYARFGRPIHITEITIPVLPNDPTGLANQAKLVRNFYRLWFSHPNVEAITWWNVSDGTAVPGEDKWRGGFLNEDLSPKPAYHALNDLINREWKTNETLSTDSAGGATFRGFYGDYTLTVRRGGKTIRREISLLKGKQNEFTIAL